MIKEDEEHSEKRDNRFDNNEKETCQIGNKEKDRTHSGYDSTLLEGLRETKLEQPLFTVVMATFWI